jgi:hypothetical protein
MAEQTKEKKKGKKDKQADEAAVPAPPPRLYVKWREELVPKLQSELGITNIHAVPRITMRTRTRRSSRKRSATSAS